MESFTAQLKAIARLTEQNMRYIAVNAIQDVMEAAQTPQRGMTKGAPSFEVGKIPVAEADLINSLTSDGIEGEDSYVVALAGMEIGGTMEFAWTAEHAAPMEFGFTSRSGKQVPGRHFVGYNAERFAGFVAKYAAEFD